MKIINILILLLSLTLLGCGDKKEKDNQSESIELKKEIDSLEAVTEELNSTEESIEASIKKLDVMFNEIEK